MSNDTVIWEEPAQHWPLGNHTTPPAWAETLIANPGKWARVQQYDTAGRAGGATTALKSRGWAWVREQGGTWEAASRSIEGKYWLFARYMGNDAPAGGAE